MRSSRAPGIVRFAYRSFDRQLIFADARLLDRPGPALWRARGERQMYLTSLFSQPLGEGPALTSCAVIPDLDHFRGSYGAKAAIPLYRNADATEVNMLPGLLDMLGKAYQRRVKPEDFLACTGAWLAGAACFHGALCKGIGDARIARARHEGRDPFRQGPHVGARLLWLHTYGERFIPKRQAARPASRMARPGASRPSPADRTRYPESFEYNDATGMLNVGGGTFAPVSREVSNSRSRA